MRSNLNVTRASCPCNVLRMLAMLFLPGLITLATGCRSAQVADSILPQLAANDAATQLEFWHTLADRKLVSNDEALHALLLYLDNQDNATDYTQRLATLKQRKILSKDFDEPRGAALTRGTLAVALVNA